MHAEIVCGSLRNPDNGNVMVLGTGLGAQASYSCEMGYDLEGVASRMCQEPGPQWSGAAPICLRELKFKLFMKIVQ